MKVGIIGALPEEIEQFKEAIEERVVVSEGRFSLIEGRLEGKRWFWPSAASAR